MERQRIHQRCYTQTIFQTSSLRELNLSANKLVSLKINCENLIKLNSSKNQLTTCELESAKQIYDLDLSGNALPDFSLPTEVNDLRFLTLNCNKLSSFPRGLENCKNLSSFIHLNSCRYTKKICHLCYQAPKAAISEVGKIIPKTLGCNEYWLL